MFSSKDLNTRVLEQSGDGPLEKYRRVLGENMNNTSTNRGLRTIIYAVATYKQNSEGLSNFYPKRIVESGGIYTQLLKKKLHFLMSCIFSISYLLKNFYIFLIQCLYETLSLINIGTGERKQFTAPAVSYFIACLSFHVLSIFGILCWVTFATSFLKLLLFHCYSQVATIFTFLSKFSGELLFRRRDRSLPYPNTLRN